MTDFGQQIEAIEKEIREIPYHKGTEHYIGRLRAKLAKLKDRLLEGGGKKGGGGGGYAVKKEGDATVVLIGPPSSGKSTLINKITNAESKVAPYEFTTVSVIPGMLKYQDAYIQILDVPGLIEGAKEGKGRGKEVLSVARASDLLLVMVDVERKESLKKLTAELEGAGIRVNGTAP
ncbi:50S ribosome-binding GTPase, partial [Candidatus Woesebacteria bacterium]|nr:50S ribosome-binding GTPase [Candidatus Woesebacteria bacterium]